jgi:molybdopterin synthase sulfur carrier subunit
MPATLRIPGALRALAGGRPEVDVEAGTLRSVLEGLGREWPELRARILDEGGTLRRHVNVFVNGEDVRFQDLLETPVREGDRVAIVPAVAGGGGA